MKELLDEGKIRSVGVSNFVAIKQYEEFHAVCPIFADQPHYNMLQREIEGFRLPWCREHGVSVMVYWPLMKGFLAGKLQRDHVWDPKDGRQKYPIFQGSEWRKNYDFLDTIRPIADEAGRSLSQLAVAWVLAQDGISCALCGAKRPDQITETAAAMDWELSDEQLEQIQAAIDARGQVASRGAV